MNRTRSAPGAVLEAIPDPEIPVVSIRELGILREINDTGRRAGSGDHAYLQRLPGHGTDRGRRARRPGRQRPRRQVVTRLAPAWTTDWIIERPGRSCATSALRRPTRQPPAKVVRFARPAANAASRMSPCPRCGSCDTTETSHFSSTACKALVQVPRLPRAVRLLQALLDMADGSHFHPLTRQAHQRPTPPARPPSRLAVPDGAARCVRFPARPVPDAARHHRRRGDAAQLFDLQPAASAICKRARSISASSPWKEAASRVGRWRSSSRA